MSRDIAEEQQKKDGVNYNLIQTKNNKKEYLEIKNRGLDWTEAKAKIKEEPMSDLTHYVPPTRQELGKNAYDAFDNLQTQMNLNLEKLSKPEFQSQAPKLKDMFNRCRLQCSIMITILKKNKDLSSSQITQIEVLIAI